MPFHSPVHPYGTKGTGLPFSLHDASVTRLALSIPGQVTLDGYALTGAGRRAVNEDAYLCQIGPATPGWLSGLFGVGGGFLLTPILILIGIPAPVAVASGANQTLGASVSGLIAQWRRGNVDARMGSVAKR